MKIEKKHIIIIAIVLAVVAYLLWKRHKSSETGGDTGGPEKSELDGMPLELADGGGVGVVFNAPAMGVVLERGGNVVYKPEVFFSRKIFLIRFRHFFLSPGIIQGKEKRREICADFALIFFCILAQLTDLQYQWELLDSNQRPPPCKGDALNQLS